MGKRQRLTKDLKLEAVRLLQTSGRPAAEVAGELGLRRNQLYKWSEQFAQRGTAVFPGSGRRTPAADELTRLQRELARVTEERAILKNPVAGSSDQRNTLWDKVELEGDRDDTHGASGPVLLPRKRTYGIRWKHGQSLSASGRALGKHAGSIHGAVSSNGGVTPAVRRRSRWALTRAEREEISRGMATARSIRQIAANLGRAPSAVSREINRHGGSHTIARGLHHRHPAFGDQLHRLQLELPRKLSLFHDPPPVPSIHLLLETGSSPSLVIEQMDTGVGPLILFSHSSIDLTNRVIKALNANGDK